MKSVYAPVLLATLIAIGCSGAALRTKVPPVTNAVSPARGVVAAGRIAPGDIVSLKAAGIRQVVDLTPDDETPDFDEATAVRANGLGYANLPLRGAADLTRGNVVAFDALLRASPKPVLVHCASGNRVGAMAALRAAWVEGRPADEAIEIGKRWGLKGLEGEVRRRIEASSAYGRD